MVGLTGNERVIIVSRPGVQVHDCRKGKRSKMAKTAAPDLKNYMRKETALLAALLALAVGFFGGVFLGVYKSGPSSKGMPAGAPAPAQQELQEQIAALEKETRQNASNVAAWIELGNAYFDSDQYERCVDGHGRHAAQGRTAAGGCQGLRPGHRRQSEA
jgi:cytochrome c-type biogenesis protein CcmH/NrfG